MHLQYITRLQVSQTYEKNIIYKGGKAHTNVCAGDMSKVTKKKRGADLGNSGLKYVKGLGKDPANRLFIPNSVYPVAASMVRESMDDEQTLKTLDFIIRAPHYPEIHDQRFFVGELALKFQQFETSARTKKTENPYILIPALAALALEAEESGEEINYQIVVGLPVSEFKNKAARQAFEKKLQGTYEIEFVSTADRQGWTVKLHIAAKVTPEGLAVIFNQQTDDKVRMVKPDWKGQAMGVIDIGDFTTDLPIMNEDGKPDSELSTGLMIGIATALDNILVHLERETGRQLNRQRVVQAIKKGYKLQHGKEQKDIKAICDEHFENIAKQIMTQLKSIINGSTGMLDVVRFFVCGGGAILLKPYLEALSDEIPSEMVWLTDDVDPVYQNAEGYYKIATVIS